ncbi:ATP-grasp domain-containing protein [Georgenia thermotolerans]|uniref:ATP-grasp domain-containing protein n=1 Tax=Georgenia thermotolerans TaxID=527326 RepID=A0A7J5UJG3_9MICO|nr:hypothetical protein [Georgenia thermotolerans]KAE8762518.1 hypothetical protein GB883_18965 [Georgenia thermotolerans]
MPNASDRFPLTVPPPDATDDGPADVVLVTGHAEHDPEAPLLVDELAARGVRAQVRPWGAGTDWAAAPLTVVRSPWDYISRCAEFLAWAREAAEVSTLVNPVEVLGWNAHKGYLARLAAAGVPVVPTMHVPAGTAELGAVLGRFDGEVVLKPAVSAGAVGVLRASADAPGAVEHLTGLTAAGDALVQPFVPAVLDRGETSLVFFGGAYSHAVSKLPAAGDYRVQGYHGGQTRAVEPTPAELAVAARALAAGPGEVAYARVDLVDLDGTPALMELELIEPDLFLAYAPGAAGRFADHLLTLLD